MKRLALACLSICVTTAIVACSGTSTITSSSSPTTTPSEKNAAEVAAVYYRAVAARNYRLAFTYIAANATGPDGRRLTYSAFLQLARTMESMAGPVTNFSAGAYSSLIVMTIERKKIGPYHAHLQMARYKGIWRIISIDRV